MVTTQVRFEARYRGGSGLEPVQDYDRKWLQWNLIASDLRVSLRHRPGVLECAAHGHYCKALPGYNRPSLCGFSGLCEVSRGQCQYKEEPKPVFLRLLSWFDLSSRRSR